MKMQSIVTDGKTIRFSVASLTGMSKADRSELMEKAFAQALSIAIANAKAELAKEREIASARKAA
jgi:transcriptional regulator of met regulon